MKITRAAVEQYAKEHGYEPLQVEGVIDGFAWKEPDIQIGDRLNKGRTVIFKPLGDMEKDISYE